MKKNILIVEDEEDIAEILEFNLESEGYNIDVVNSAEDAMSAKLDKYDLFLLDVMLGGMSGYKFAHKIRKKKGLSTPIIFITAKKQEIDTLTGFTVGADDYISKPFSIREVVARIKAVLQRSNNNTNAAKASKNIKIKDLKINLDKKSVKVDGKKVDLTKKEFEILLLLIQNEGKIFSRNDILAKVWDMDVIVADRTVDVNIARIRKKIGEYGVTVKSKSGYGYYFDKLALTE